MAKITLASILTAFASAVSLNSRFSDVEDHLNDKVLYRDNVSGEANEMKNDLDMNSNRILNLPSATTPNEPITYGQYVSGAEVIDLTGTSVSEELSASADGQTLFTLSVITYTQGSKNLSVYRNGVRLPHSSYVETSTSSITLNDGSAIRDGDEFEFVVNERDISTDVVPASNVTYTDVDSVVTNVQSALSSVETKLAETVSVKDFGAVGDGVTDDTAAIQACADYVKTINGTITIPDGDYLMGATIDLSSPGGGDPGHRNLEVKCGHEAKFIGTSNAVDLFDISGQKRFKWSGGWFRTANICFDASGGVGPAYVHFSDVIFDGDGTIGIKRCYKADTSLGVFWDNCQFGTDNSPDQIELAVELTGADSDQTNINKFKQCAFINCRNGVQMADSSYARLQESFVDCWFESIGGYAISVGDNTKGMALVRCYFEACGSVSETPIILKNMTLDMEGCQMVGLQGNDDHFITANTGASINTYGTNEFQSSAGRKFVNYTALASYQNLNGIRVIDQSTSGTLTYKDLLFDTVAQSDEKYINWSMPALSSTLTDVDPQIVSRKNEAGLGFLSKVTDVVQLAAVSTNYDIATVNLPTSGGCRISAEAYQTIQGVGHAGAYTEILAHWNGATWIFTNITAPVVTVAGFTFTFVSVDSTHFKIQAQRTLGATANTPFRALIKAQQASDNMFGKELIIT